MTKPGVVFNQCDDCRKFYSLKLTENGVVSCPHCSNKTWKINRIDSIFNRCFYCDSGHFYRQKRFNPVLGIAIILVGAALVPVTYGLSLPFLFLIDLLLRKKIRDSAVCYKCRAEFRGLDIPSRIKPFDHHVAAMFEEDYTST